MKNWRKLLWLTGIAATAAVLLALPTSRSESRDDPSVPSAFPSVAT